MRVLTVLGTRPEAIKLAPVMLALNAQPGVEHSICVTGQHRTMLDQVLGVFALSPDHDLNVMKPGQGLTHITSAVIEGMAPVIEKTAPDWVVVQGDTTTAFGAALAAFYARVPVAHVEAGLRTGNIYSPWPEEMNRKLVGALTSLHFPPTELSRQNLLAEGIRDSAICVTGNTVIDALQWIRDRLERDPGLAAKLETQFAFLDPSRRLILVTGHRRENFDGGLEQVCLALRSLADRGDVEVVYPVHLNPRVRQTVQKTLANHARVHLIEPLEYGPFVALMCRAYLIVTDSGGIQEEAPSLGKPVLVTRDTTERPEAIQAGTAKLVGTSAASLLTAATTLLDSAAAYAAMAQARNPFGDGTASAQIVTRLLAAG